MIGFNARALGVPNPGGPGRVGRELLKQLDQIEDNLVIFGHESIESNYSSLVDSSCFASNSRPYGMFWEQTILPYRSYLQDVDVVYSPNSLLPIIWKSKKFVITIHDVASLEGYSSGWYQRYEQLKLPIVSRRADRIITVSEFSKSQIVKKLNVPPSKVAVVYNGVGRFFRDDSPGKELDLPERYILYVGDRSKRKNIEGVLSAYSRFRREMNRNCKLVLIGPSDSPTVDDISTINIPGVTYIGYVSDAELKYAYRNAELFLFPSRYEGFGISPLEAMSCGTPVIASNQSALPEILGDAALYVDPEKHDEIAQSIERLLNDDDLAADLRARGYERTSKYKWEDSAEELRSVLQEVTP